MTGHISPKAREARTTPEQARLLKVLADELERLRKEFRDNQRRKDTK